MHEVKLTFNNKQIAQLLLKQIWAAFQIEGYLLSTNDSNTLRFIEHPSEELNKFIQKFSDDVKSLAPRAQAKNLFVFGSTNPQILKPTNPKDFCMSDIPGVVANLGELEEILEEIDQFLMKEFAPFESKQIRLAQILPQQRLEQMGYLPRDKKQVANLIVDPQLHENCCLTPAVCLPLYPLLPQLIDTTNKLAVNSRGFAHRNESGQFDSETPALRLRHFQVRELIQFGSSSHIAEAKIFFISLAEKFAAHFEIQIQIVTANDIFFEPQDSKLAILQLLSQSKLEMIAQIGEKKVSLGSFNNHDDHFTNLYLPDIKELKSCCIAIGLERAAYAIACRRGEKYE